MGNQEPTDSPLHTVQSFARKGLTAIKKRGIDRASLAMVSRTPTDASRLGRFDEGWLRSAWELSGWDVDEGSFSSLEFPESALGVNPGDRRALYQIVRRLQPRRILEVGTHIGASTVALALAAQRNAGEGHPCRIDTVDIDDVNHPSEGHWVRYGAPRSPVDNLRSLGLDGLVEFFAADSREWLGGSHEPYDLIFLDGNHNPDCVYREVPLALSVLAPGGTIMLHDFFPGGAPLWAGSPAIFGPWQAISRHIREGAKFHALPLGILPWPTKRGTNITSLAILTRVS